MPDVRAAAKSRWSLYLMAAIGIAPVVTSYALYHFWRPSSFTNYGRLLSPTPIRDGSLRHTDGTAFRFGTLKGKWIFLTVDSGQCEAQCQTKLYKMRQVRLTQGADMDRIERAWLIDDAVRPVAQLAADYAGTHQVLAKDSPVIAQLPAEGSVRDHIYVIDPLGNLMMRYPRDADPSRMKKDVTRLLKVSRAG